MKNSVIDAEVLKKLLDYSEKIRTSKTKEGCISLFEELTSLVLPTKKTTFWLTDNNKTHIINIIDGKENIIKIEKKEIIKKVIESNKKVIEKIEKNKTGKFDNILAMPIKAKNGEIIGILECIDKEITQTDENIIKIIGSHFKNSVEVVLKTREITESQKEIITLLTELCEKRSLESGNHVKRIVRFSEIIGRALGKTKEETDILGQASTLHDIGKLSIPDTILQKKGKLTDKEYLIMKHHSEIGYRMLMKSDKKILRAGAIIAYQHHEKYNGEGYPLGLKGDEIDIYAKIVALCDVFDALTSKRVYKSIWPIEEALNLIKRERGKHFAPEVVDAFFTLLPEIITVMEELKD